MPKINYCYLGFELECPKCYDSLCFQPVLKPDGTEDCYLATKPCAMCGTILEINYHKDTNMVIATLKENDCES